MEHSERWHRRRLEPGGDRPFVFTVVYGVTDVPASIDARRYRTRGLRAGVDARVFDRVRNAGYLRESFEEGYAWDALLREDPELSELVARSAGTVALAGDVAEADSLEYLRDLIGITAALVDHGCCGL